MPNSIVQCDGCGAHGLRLAGNACPDLWHFIPSDNHTPGQEGHIYMVYACSEECKASMWKRGPGPGIIDDVGAMAERAHDVDVERAEIDRVANILIAAWAKAEPDHGVTKHPVSYRATFADLAREVIRDRRSRNVESSVAEMAAEIAALQLLDKIRGARVAFAIDPGGPEMPAEGMVVIEGWIRQFMKEYAGG